MSVKRGYKLYPYTVSIGPEKFDFRVRDDVHAVAYVKRLVSRCLRFYDPSVVKDWRIWLDCRFDKVLVSSVNDFVNDKYILER